MTTKYNVCYFIMITLFYFNNIKILNNNVVDTNNTKIEITT